MIINVISTEKIEDNKYKVTAKEGEFYAKENGIQPGVYDIETKPMVMKGQQIKVITGIIAVKEQAAPPAVEKKKPSSVSTGEGMSKGDWAKKDREIVKQSVMKAVMGSPGLSMIAATKSEDDVLTLYDKAFKRMMKSISEVD